MKDLAHLISRLHRISSHIRNAPTAVDPDEQSSRDSLIRYITYLCWYLPNVFAYSMLQKTTSELENLRKDGITSMSSIAQDIIGCSSKINEYMLEYLVKFNVLLW